MSETGTVYLDCLEVSILSPAPAGGSSGPNEWVLDLTILALLSISDLVNDLSSLKLFGFRLSLS